MVQMLLWHLCREYRSLRHTTWGVEKKRNAVLARFKWAEQQLKRNVGKQMSPAELMSFNTSWNSRHLMDQCFSNILFKWQSLQRKTIQIKPSSSLLFSAWEVQRTVSGKYRSKSIQNSNLNSSIFLNILMIKRRGRDEMPYFFKSFSDGLWSENSWSLRLAHGRLHFLGGFCVLFKNSWVMNV